MGIRETATSLDISKGHCVIFILGCMHGMAQAALVVSTDLQNAWTDL